MIWLWKPMPKIVSGVTGSPVRDDLCLAARLLLLGHDAPHQAGKVKSEYRQKTNCFQQSSTAAKRIDGH
jgi:hypothetical protein